VESFGALLASEITALPVPGPTDLSAIFFTSGTTGLSKGVMMPQAHLVFFADSVVSLCRITDRDVHMSVGPLFHGNAQFMAAYPAFIAGARYVMREKFSASNWSRWIRDSKVTVTNFLGAMMDWVWKTPPDPIDSDNVLRCLFSAPTASSIMDGFRQRFGVKDFVEVFGLTETSPMILTPYGMPRPVGAAGAASTWYDIRLVNPDNDEEVPVGEVGELTIRAKYPWTTCQGYYGMPDKTIDMFRNCWLHTGDGLRRDAEGWYFFVDRLKDAIRRGGENISSYEVEQAVLGHPAIAECSAVGVPADAEAGEDEVMVCMVLVPGEKLAPDDAWAWCDKRLPKFASPRYLAFLDALPATPSGKIRKAALRELKPEQRHDRGPTLRKPRAEKTKP
jgi:crotonobetaine/carnitine-CoA ligase